MGQQLGSGNQHWMDQQGMSSGAAVAGSAVVGSAVGNVAVVRPVGDGAVAGQQWPSGRVMSSDG